MRRPSPHPRERFTPCVLLQVAVVVPLLLLTSLLDRFELMPRWRPPRR